ncbi:hypothetical protein SK128_019743, partial [Halocaridina rubra]
MTLAQRYKISPLLLTFQFVNELKRCIRTALCTRWENHCGHPPNMETRSIKKDKPWSGEPLKGQSEKN